MKTPISRFTPGVMSRATLEALFVARGSVLETIMRAIQTAADGQGLNQTLVVAPRGAGKSHLITLAHHRTADLIRDGVRLQLARLPEDPWRIVNYASLLASVLAQVSSEGPDSERVQLHEALASSRLTGLGEGELEGRLLRQVAQGGPIVVLVENLDQILGRLGELGQQRLRHLLQASQALLLVASSTRLDRNLSDQARPFYGFFTTMGLPPFDDGQARDLLIAVANLQGDTRAVQRLRDPSVMARIKAIGRLTGGQPRTWVGLADALALDDVGQLVEQLIVRLDDLSPYYQERLAGLSSQQRQIVIELASADQALHVADLAARVGAEQRSIGRSMTDLVDLGWVVGVRSRFNNLVDRRRTYYELADPLVKVTFQLKESRGSTLSAVVETLNTWFEPDRTAEAEIRADKGETAWDGPGQDVSAEVIDTPPAGSGLRGLGEVDLALCALARGDATNFLALPSAVRLSVEEGLGACDQVAGEMERLRIQLHLKVRCKLQADPGAQIKWWLARAEDEVAANPTSVGWRMVLVGWLADAGRPQEAELLLNSLAEDISPAELVGLRLAGQDLAPAGGPGQGTAGETAS